MVDHVHMCLPGAPKHSIAFVIGFLKGKSAWVTIDNSLHSEGESLRTLYGTKGFANNYRVENSNGKSILISLPPGHVTVLEKR